MNDDYLAVCTKCHSRLIQNEVLHCGVDGRVASEHAANGQCPLGKFGEPQNKLVKVEVRRDAGTRTQATGTQQKRGCGCSRRAKAAAETVISNAIAENKKPSPPAPTKIAVPFTPSRASLKFFVGDSIVPIANLFRGKSAFLICGGPSFASVDKSLLDQPGVLVAAINNSVASYRPHIWVHGDQPDHFIRSAYFDPTIMKFTPTSFRNEAVFNSDTWTYTDCVLRDCPPNQYFFERACGFDAGSWLTSNRVIWGNEGDCRSTMFAAIRILYELGIRTIYLLGADFQMEKGRNYHFDENKHDGAVNSNNGMYATMSKRFALLKPHFDMAGLRVWNCNLDSHLTVFPMIPFEHAVAACKAEFGVDIANERTNGLYNGTKPEKPIIKTKPLPTPKSGREFNWGKPLPSDHPRVYSHWGKAGDLIYGLPTIKALGGGTLNIVMGRGITDAIAAGLKPLIEKQPYIERVTISREIIGVDFSRWKERSNLLKFERNLADQQLEAFALPHSWSHKEPWLAVDDSIFAAEVVIHRSPRYHNDLFPWKKVLAKYRDRIVMVGSASEHQDFCNRFGQVPYRPTKDYLELAHVIAGAKLYIGNQSSPYAVAEGMKVRTLQETCLRIPNCAWKRAGAIYGRDANVELPEL